MHTVFVVLKVGGLLSNMKCMKLLTTRTRYGHELLQRAGRLDRELHVNISCCYDFVDKE